MGLMKNKNQAMRKLRCMRKKAIKEQEQKAKAKAIAFRQRTNKARLTSRLRGIPVYMGPKYMPPLSFTHYENRPTLGVRPVTYTNRPCRVVVSDAQYTPVHLGPNTNQIRVKLNFSAMFKDTTGYWHYVMWNPEDGAQKPSFTLRFDIKWKHTLSLEDILNAERRRSKYMDCSQPPFDKKTVLKIVLSVLNTCRKNMKVARSLNFQEFNEDQRNHYLKKATHILAGKRF